MRLSDSHQPPILVEDNVPQPQPKRDELMVRVYTAGVTSKELLCIPPRTIKVAGSATAQYRGMSSPGLLRLLARRLSGSRLAKKYTA